MKGTPPPLHMRKILLVLNQHHFCYVEILEVLKLQTSDNTIVSNEYNRLFLLNAHHLQYMSSRVVGLDMVDFAAHFTIHTTK